MNKHKYIGILTIIIFAAIVYVAIDQVQNWTAVAELLRPDLLTP